MRVKHGKTSDFGLSWVLQPNDQTKVFAQDSMRSGEILWCPKRIAHCWNKSDQLVYNRSSIMNHSRESTISGCYKPYPIVGYSCTTLSLEVRATVYPLGCHKHLTIINICGCMGLNFQPMLINSHTNVPADLSRMPHHNRWVWVH